MQKLSLTTIFLGIVSVAGAQYGYGIGTGLDTTDYESSLKADLADGSLDHSSNTDLLVGSWKPTYYIRGSVIKSSQANFTVASVVSGKNFPPLGSAPSGSRICQGVGIRSDNNRWKSIQSLPASDPWKNRFVNATNQVWYVELGLDENGQGEGIGDINGGWPQTTGYTNIGRDNPWSNPNDVPGTGSTENPVDAFYPQVTRTDAAVKPWVVTLDYWMDPPEPGGISNYRIYDAKLDYAKDQVPGSGRAFKWIRAIDGPSNDPTNIFYPGNAQRTRFAWETDYEEGGGGVWTQHFKDLRVVTFPRNEYAAVNVGVINGPTEYTEIRPGTKKFQLAADVFATFGAPLNSGQHFNNGQRFAFMNAPEYVRNPGDMVVSYDRKRIYFIPYSQLNIFSTLKTDPDDVKQLQVLNVSLPTRQPGSDDRTYEAPLMVVGSAGFRLQGVTFSACAGAGISVRQAGLAPNQNHDMYLYKCSFKGIGLTGASIIHSKASKVVECEFDDIQGRAYVFNQSHPMGPAFTYEDYRTQADTTNVFWGNSIRTTGRMHPSIAAVNVLDKPSQFWIGANNFEDIPGISILFTGSRSYVYENSLTRTGSDVAEVGSIYTGRSFSNFGTLIHGNIFVNCVKGSEWGMANDAIPVAQQTPFDQTLACVMLDDATSGATIRHNNFSQTANNNGPGVKNIQNVPIVMNGGSYNLIEWNLYPGGATSSEIAIQGFQTVKDIASFAIAGTTGSFVRAGTNSWDDLVKDFVPIPDPGAPAPDPTAIPWQFGTTTWTGLFGPTGAFPNGSGSDYYGADWINSSSTQNPYQWLTKTNGDRFVVANASYWLSNATVRAKWFRDYSNVTWLNCRGNKIQYDPAVSGNVSSRIHGHLNNPAHFPNAMSYVTGTAPTLISEPPPAPF